MTKSLLIALALSLSACSHFDRAVDTNGSIYSRRAYSAGRAEAHRDLARGVLAIEYCGLRRGEMIEDADRLMRERYGVLYRPIAGCMVNEQVLGHAKGYDDVTRPEILRRFGPDCFDRVLKEAENRFYRKHPNALRE